jgi:regulator of sigma E protease
MNLLLFILFFGALVFLHELGHFIMARVFKIEVEEFGFGFPPRITKLFTLGGTDITLNWIPFGGFVRPKGENDPNVPGGLASASPWKRLGVLLGGPAMNLLTGVLILSFIFTMGGDSTPKTVDISSVAADSPAEQAGIRPGDIIAAFNGQKITGQDQLRALIQANLGKEVTITYQRNGQDTDVKITPRQNPPENQGAVGITMLAPKLSFFEALPYGLQLTGLQAKELIAFPGRLIRGQLNSQEARVVGPVGMYSIFSQTRERDTQDQATPQSGTAPYQNTLYLIGIISVALGYTNLLPIPALDGGRILFLLPEFIIRRRVPAEYENMIHLIGFAALIALMIYVTAQDFINPIVLPK